MKKTAVGRFICMTVSTIFLSCCILAVRYGNSRYNYHDHGDRNDFNNKGEYGGATR